MNSCLSYEHYTAKIDPNIDIGIVNKLIKDMSYMGKFLRINVISEPYYDGPDTN